MANHTAVCQLTRTFYLAGEHQDDDPVSADEAQPPGNTPRGHPQPPQGQPPGPQPPQAHALPRGLHPLARIPILPPGPQPSQGPPPRLWANPPNPLPQPQPRQPIQPRAWDLRPLDGDVEEDGDEGELPLLPEPAEEGDEESDDEPWEAIMAVEDMPVDPEEHPSMLGGSVLGQQTLTWSTTNDVMKLLP